MQNLRGLSLEAINAFFSFLVSLNVLPHQISQHKVKLKKPSACP